MPTMTDIFETVPVSVRSTKPSSRRRSSKKKTYRSSKHGYKLSSKFSSRYSSRLLTPSRTPIKLIPRQSKRSLSIANSRTHSFAVREDPGAEEADEEAEGGRASTTRSSTDSFLLGKPVPKRSVGCQTQFEDDTYGPMHECLPQFIQRLRERRVAAAAARGHRSSTKLCTSSRSTQTQPYEKGGKVQDGEVSQTMMSKVHHLLKQHEEVLYALAMLNEKKDKRHSRSASAGAAGGAVCRLNLEFEDDRLCDSPDTDVYSEFNSPRSRLEAADLKLPGRRRFATEPRRTASGRHGIPGHQEESSADSETEGIAGKRTTKVKIGSSSPKQRKFSNVPPLNLAKISSAVAT